MSNKYCAFTEFKKIRKNFFYRWCICNHCIINACQFLYIVRYRSVRVNKCTKSLCNYLIYYLDCTYLYNIIAFCTYTCCFKVKYNKLSCKVLSFVILYCSYKVIYKICFNTIYNFKVIIRCKLMCRIRECLYNSMVCYRYCLMSPPLSSFYIITDIHY